MVADFTPSGRPDAGPSGLGSKRKVLAPKKQILIARARRIRKRDSTLFYRNWNRTSRLIYSAQEQAAPKTANAAFYFMAAACQESRVGIDIRETAVTLIKPR